MTRPAHLAAYAGVRTIVLGASGFIGRWVGRVLTKAGSDLHLVVRDGHAARKVFDEFDVAGQIHEQDLSQPSGLADLFRMIRPAVVFNLVGYGVDPAERNDELARRINTELVKAAAEAAAAVADRSWCGQNFVHVGSALEYGTTPANLAEDGPATPTTLYGQTKLAGTVAVQQISRTLALTAVTARLFTVYGPGEHDGRLLPSLLKAAQSGTPLNLTAGHQMRDFTYVEDVADGLLRLGACGQASGQIVNLASGRLTKVRDFVVIASGIFEIPSQNLILGAISTRPEEMCHADVTIDRLRRLVRWTPNVSIAEGIQRTWGFTNRQCKAVADSVP